jgi:PAS domain S-box-containing protein
MNEKAIPPTRAVPSQAKTQEWLAQTVVREAADAIVVADPDGTIQLWNTGAANVFGYFGR